jgi:dienelactone hydrolase
MRFWLAILIFACGGFSAFAQSEKVVEIPSRGQKFRALLIQPANPVGSVILLAGGHGKLDISADGRIGWGARNQVVRTRAAYAKAGYAVLVPDIAPDMKTPSGVVRSYRASETFAQDLAAAVQYMRKIRNPVVMIGTSRGTLSVANELAHIADKAGRPDAAVLTSAFLASPPSKGLTVRKLVHNKAGVLALPMLIVHHRKDGCEHTQPSDVEPFRAWYEKNGRKLDVIWMEGGLPAKSEPCNALSPHGFYGLDNEVVGRITGWIKAQSLPQ